jgi:hypothetical protein
MHFETLCGALRVIYSRTSSCKVLLAQPVDATPSGVNLFSKGGVHESRETMEAVFGPAVGYVEPSESGRVVA